MKLLRAFKTVNIRLWAAIFISMILPTIYQTVRIFFLGELPSDSGVNIASQMSWVNLFYEVAQEALILPLFHLLGKSLNDSKEFANKVRTGITVTAAVYVLVSIILVSAAKPLVVFMAQNNELIDVTVTYVRIETVGGIFSTLWRFISLVLVTLKKEKYMFILLIIQMLLTIILDTFLVSTLEVSLNIGVNGIAISNIIVNFVIFIVALILLRRENISFFVKTKWNFCWLKEWLSVGKYSGLESLLRNVVFMVMVIRMVNIVAEQGIYWVANNFIWQWLLIPSLALADVVKKEVGESEDNIRAKTFGYLCMATLFALLWLVSIPLWKLFLRYVLNCSEYNKVFNVVLIETGFYVTFIFNSTVFDSTFYGLGKTGYMLIQSICIDGFYYGILFILYLTGVYKPTLNGICLMFGIGMGLDFIPTFILYVRLLVKKGIKIDFKLQ
ncbi:putative multidrug transporter [Monocercomonoides exilis]|uniref:putative multidrug transporter n=1 Tax=Monocercomonoides exilis TaxID=2049356 RepID=UPI0035599411|nr:putative multidrug transporter [Monocercomonoides exilis]|eukprot:MONOS_13436.1-p1 / transcript=MONOS_13436.1 / gene=MONOS_13436 / organism=Monocercomonoides_exilis_PA203 / gene_product=na / transcript_product=na / location=Mono_scaffold00828:17574-18899(+) / protein_length=441 / sequence_SO=supercontig / SO=protein_coding / is_pseudo=false